MNSRLLRVGMLSLVAILFTVVVGCGQAPPPPVDRATLEKEAEKLRQQTEREMQNK